MGVPKTVAVPAASAMCMVMPGVVIMGMVIMRIMGVVMIMVCCAACMRMGVRICCMVMPCGAGGGMSVPVICLLARRSVRMTTGRTRRLGRGRRIVRRRHGKAFS